MTTIVLAAGRSTRMGGGLSKVLLEVAGRPLLGYLLDAVRDAGVGRIIVVTRARGDEVEMAFQGQDLEFAVQVEQRGTADAVLACRDLLFEDEECLVLCGDAPLLRPVTIRRLGECRQAVGADVAVLTAQFADPSGYGRVIRGDGDRVRAIVEERDARPEERAVREVNSGAYSFRWGRLLPLLEALKPSPVSGELYLTDAVRAITNDGGLVVALPAEDPDEILGANTPDQLARVAELLGRRGR